MLLADTRPTTADIRPLRAHCAGDVVVPGERVWPAAVAAWGLTEDAPPAAVVFPAGDYDVVAVEGFTRYLGLDVVLEGDALPDDPATAVLVHAPGSRTPWS